MAYNSTSWTTDGSTTGVSVGNYSLYKQFGIWDFSPVAGYHFALSSLNSVYAGSSSGYDVNDKPFGNGTDPATSVNVDANAEDRSEVLQGIWYIEDNIVIDKIRVIASADGNQAINFHVMSYDMDVSSNHGDLSNGTLHAHIGSSISATNTTIKTGTLEIDEKSIAANKVVFALAEAETGTSDITCQMTIKYHLV